MFFKKQKGFQRKKKKQFQLSLLQRQLLIGLALFVLVAILLTGIYYGSRISSMQINSVEVVGGFTISHDFIEEEVEDELVGAYLHLIPKRFVWMYPKDTIVESISKIERIKNVHVERTGKKEITVAFEEYRPFALWCPTIDAKKCVFLDEHGYAFANAPTLSGNALARYVKDDEEVQLKTAAFDSTFVQTTQDFSERLERELSFYVTHIHKIGDYDIEYHISGGGILKVSQTISSDESFDNLQTILQSAIFDHIEPGNFQYIDLRFGDKVFVNETKEEVATSTATSTDTQ